MRFPSGNSRGMTLIEILMVLAIVMLLAGLIYPVITGAFGAGRSSQAATDCMAIETAVMQYFDDFNGRLPVDSGYGASDVFYDEDASADILAVLQGDNDRSKRYLDSDRAESDEGGVVLLDPWGNPYRIFLDTNMDGGVRYLYGVAHYGTSQWDNVRRSTRNRNRTRKRAKRVVVVSAGPDGRFGGTEDWDADNVDNIANVDLTPELDPDVDFGN